MENQTLYNLFDPTVTIGHANNFALRNAEAPGFSCPSDLEPELMVPHSGPEGGFARRATDAKITVPRRRGFWAHTWGGYIQSQAWMDPRMFLGDYEKCTKLTGPGSGNACMAMWYSFHPGGANFMRCDGSVSFVQFDIDLETFGSLCSIAGGEIIESL